MEERGWGNDRDGRGRGGLTMGRDGLDIKVQMRENCNSGNANWPARRVHRSTEAVSSSLHKI